MAPKENRKREKKKSDIEILFSSDKVEGYTIRPFSLRDMEKLTPWFQKIAIKFAKEKININFDELKADRIQGVITALNILPELAEGLSILFDEDIEKIRDFDLIRIQSIVFVIISKNFEYLKNSFSLMGGLARSLTSKASS
jgi:hypothetical protein